MNEDLSVIIQAVLEKSGITKELSEIQKIVDKNLIEIKPKLETASLKNNLKEVSNLIADSINKAYKNVGNVDFKVTGNDVFKILNQIEKQAETTAQKLNKIQLSFDTGSYQSKVDSLVARTNQWVDANGNARISTESLQTALNNLGTAYTNLNSSGGNTVANQQALIEAEKALDTEVKKVQSSITSMNSTMAKSSAIDALRQKYQEFYDKNTASHQKWGKSLLSAINELAPGAEVSKQRVQELNQQLINTSNAARQAGKLGLSFFDGIAEQAKKFTQWVSVTSVVMEGVQTLRKMKDAVYDVDTAMTNLYKVTDETDAKYNKFLNNACDNAQKLGRSVSSLVEQTANWAKLGYNIDQAEQLAQISSIYANVGEVDDATAVSDMVTAMKAFNIEASNAITIVDMLNTLGNKYATSAADLGSGLSRSASAMATAGTDIEKTLAMLTGGSEITQSAEEFGNMLKIGSMRVRGMKGELEALGEEVDKNMESISKIQTQVLNLTHGKVNIFNDNSEFKDYYDIMEDVAKIYSDLSSTEQASLSEILFGKQRGNQGAALIQAFQSGQIQKAYADIQDSAGSAYEEQARWMESLEAKAAQFEAAFQSLSNTVLDSGLLKGLVDLGTISVKSIDDIINGLGQLNSFFSGGFLGLNSNGISGTLGAISGLLMNKSGIGKRTVFQW
ncbi:MAG: phage tail tape measure protein [Bacilli bacterium]|nr:phage tail tape measure protein [Bacilli bacterium]